MGSKWDLIKEALLDQILASVTSKSIDYTERLVAILRNMSVAERNLSQ